MEQPLTPPGTPPAAPPAAAASGQRPLSPDGRFYWDGAAWLPVPWKSLYQPGPVEAPGDRKRRLHKTALLSSGMGLLVGAAVIVVLMLVIGLFMAQRGVHVP